MLSLLRRTERDASRAAAFAARVPSGIRVYAIGDIHGRADLLDALLEEIRRDDQSRPAKRRVLVFLGDYIDRGSDSAGVLERLSTLRDEGEEAYFILGNHEEALLRLLAGEDRLLDDWLRFGGRECLASYNIDPSRIESDRPIGEQLNELLPAHHRTFLEACEDSVSIGDYLFVHAGIRPGRALDAQLQRDLRWIREPFLQSRADHGAIVVHGHSISETVDWRANRIGIDTGAYRTGRLTALVLSGRRRRSIEVVDGRA